MFARSFGRNAARKALVRASAIGLAVLGTYCPIDLAGAPPSASLYAQSIINQSRGSSNSFQGFSTRRVEKIAALPSTPAPLASREQVGFAAPAASASAIDGATLRVPFTIPERSKTIGVKAVKLYYSADRGATWRQYDSVGPTDRRTEFFFEAPKPGEYWLALQTSLNNGAVTASSTRAFRFSQGKEPEDDVLLPLSEDGGEPTLGLDDSDAPSLLPLSDGSEETLYMNETAAEEANSVSKGAGANGSPNNFSLNDDSDEQEPPAPPAAAEHAEGEIVPRPGRFKTLSFGKEAETDKLMVFVRWFRPDDLDEQYRGKKATISLDYGPTPEGPWTAVAKDLSLDESGYGWIATADNMKPFYVRATVTDESGESWTDVTSDPLDVSTPGVKEALGVVNTPAPFATKKLQKTASKESVVEKRAKPALDGGNEDGVELVRTTASEGETKATPAAKSESEADSIDKAREAGKSPEKEKAAKTRQPYRERPVVPAPTNPNQLEVNPLFTRGVSVLYRSAQTRYEPDNGGKRSIFTPPSQARRAASVPPAQRYRSPAQIAAARQREALEKMEKDAKYAREHEMEMLEQKPELMQGRVFYMDANGNMTTTPPPEFLQASNEWQISSVGDPVPVGTDGAVPNVSANGGAIVSGAEPPIYMPQNTDDYDASARSGAAIMNPYVNQGEASGSSPLNDRYGTGAGQPAGTAPQQVPNTNGMGMSYQTIPQTAYTQNYPTVLPYGYSAPSPNYVPQTGGAPSSFPPRPSVSR